MLLLKTRQRLLHGTMKVPKLYLHAASAVGNSVMKAAEAAGTKVIGVDVDQSAESETVITSSMKNLSKSVYDALAAYYAGNFRRNFGFIGCYS